MPEMAHLDTVTMQPPRVPSGSSQDMPAPPHPEPPAPPERPRDWFAEPFETREKVRNAQERADRASRRADRAARRVREAQERAGSHRTGTRQLMDVAGDAATAALTAVSAAADEAQARLVAKARMRELEHAVVIVRAGGRVDVSPPTREEALRLAGRVDPGSSRASVARGVGFIFAGIAALVLTLIGGFGWLAVGVPVAILISGGWLGNQLETADQERKAARIQLELARATIPGTELPAGDATKQLARGVRDASALPGTAVTAAPPAGRPRLVEDGDPRTRSEVVARLDRLVGNVRGLVDETDVATLQRIRDSAALALPPTDVPLDMADHETWLLRQICIDYLPAALEHYIALPPERASEPVLDGRSARQVLDEQLALIESRLDLMATRTYQREAGGLLTHARFLGDVLRPDPFQARLAELAGNGPDSGLAAAPEPVHTPGTSATMDGAAGQTRGRV